MRRVEVASSSQLAADAGAAVADAGGNAVDVALAAVLVSMCAEPGIIAPGASGFLTIWPAGGDPATRGRHPGRGRPGVGLTVSIFSFFRLDQGSISVVTMAPVFCTFALVLTG